MQLLISSLTCC